MYVEEYLIDLRFLGWIVGEEGRPIKRGDLSVCHQCQRVYKHRHTLNRHLRYECNKKPAFSCIYCNYAARRKYILLEHVRGSHKEEFDNFSQNIYKFLYSDVDSAAKE